MKSVIKSIRAGNLEPITEVDPWFWAYYNKMKLADGFFDIKGREFQSAWMQSQAQRKVARKATQLTFTQSEVLDSLHGCIHGYYPKGVLYLFPTRNDVTDFSAARFKPLITENHHTIGQHVKDTNRENLRRVGGGLIYFRSGYVDGSSLKGIPCDKVVFDEFDEMTPAARGLAIERMADSDLKKETYLANPTMQDVGVDKIYEDESDRRIWEIRCQKCGKYSCLETHFPQRESGQRVECLERLRDGRVIRICPKCRDRELYTRDGQWVPRNPDRTDWMEGYWLSHLNHQRKDLKLILDRYEMLDTLKPYEVSHFWNLTLGMGYVAAENRLSVEQVLALCSTDGIPNIDPGPCTMGVDQGSDIHVVISRRLDNKSKIVYLGILKDWEELEGLMKYFNIVLCVVDALPEIRNARAFAERYKDKVYLNYYNEHQKGHYAWNERDLIVSSNRTESLDASHKEIMDGIVILPKPCEIVQEFAKHLHNIAKKLEEDEESGSKRYVYVKLGPDHFRHAFNYERIASDAVSHRYFSEYPLI